MQCDVTLIISSYEINLITTYEWEIENDDKKFPAVVGVPKSLLKR